MPTVATVIITTADKIMIGWFSVDKIQNGYYEQAIRIENLVFSIFSALYITMRSRMAFLYSIGNVDEIKRYASKSLSLVFFISFPIFIGIVQISDLFVPWFLGADFSDVSLILKVLSFWLVIKSFSNCLLEQLILPNGGYRTFTRIVWVGAISNVVLNFFLIPLFSSVGAAISSIVAEFLIPILSFMKTKNVINLKRICLYAWKPCVSSIGMFCVTFIIKFYLIPQILDTILIVFIGSLSYIFFEFILRDHVFISFTKDLFKMVKKNRSYFIIYNIKA